MRKHLLFLLLFFMVINTWGLEPQREMTISMKEAVFLSLRFNPVVIGAEVQRIVDKFNLAVAKNQFEFQYALTGAGAQTNSISGGNLQTTSGSYNLVPAIQRQTIYGTTFNLALSNPVTYSANPSNPPTTFYNPALALVVTQPLIKGSGREVVEIPLKTAINSELITRFNFKNSIMSNVTQIMVDYWAVVGAENALTITKNALAVSIQTVKNNKIQISLGFLAPSENVQAEAAVATQRIQVASSENQLLQAKLTLLKDMGLSPHTILHVDKKISIEGITYPTGQEAECLLLKNNPSYQSALLGMENSKLALLQAEDQQRWTLNLVGTVVQGGGSGGGKNGGIQSLFNGYNKSNTLALALNVPIDNLPIQQQLVAAKTSYTQAQLALQLLKLNLVTQLLSTLENLKILRAQIDLAKQSVALSYQSYQDALKKANFGQASMFEVTTLQTNYVNASFTELGAEISFLVAVAQYKQLLGLTLNMWDINLVY